jgi:dihydroxyacetone kinase-like protein
LKIYYPKLESIQMPIEAKATLLPQLIQSVSDIIIENAEEVTELDRVIGDGDHVVNLQRGIDALNQIKLELSEMTWSDAYKKIGMTLMSTMGGASGSLFGTLFISMAKASKDNELNQAHFADIFEQGINSVKLRGKSDLGEKTMLDTLIPVSKSLMSSAESNFDLNQALKNAQQVAYEGMLSTKDMLPTKGRSSFLGERAIGHIDAGARTSQLMIHTIAEELLTNLD